ncbi:hydroxymethylbilane synthase, partial [Pseudomonas aeruginosa]
MTIKIGTRKSRLALAQTEMLIKTLKNRFPNVKIETVYISTTGDKTLDKPLTALGGKGVFIKELEMSLLSGETD